MMNILEVIQFGALGQMNPLFFPPPPQ